MAGILYVCHIICTFARKTEKGVKVFLRAGLFCRYQGDRYEEKRKYPIVGIYNNVYILI